MSNKSEPHHKFVQTFVLAEQTNGYYVLNDIFRYLNNDEDEIIEDEPAQAEPDVEVAEAPVAEDPAAEEPIKGPEEVTDDAAVEQVDAKLEEHANAEEGAERIVAPEVMDVNGMTEEPSIEEPLAGEELPAETREVAEEIPPAAFVSEDPPEPEHTPIQSPPPKDANSAPASEAPPAKKTWANLVGSKAPAVPALPASGAPTPSQPRAQKVAQTAPAQPTSTDDSGSPTSQGNGWQTADHGKKQNRPQAKAASEQTTLAYIKSVNERVDARVLKEVLERYGELKYFDVSRPRVSLLRAFLDRRQQSSSTTYAALHRFSSATTGGKRQSEVHR